MMFCLYAIALLYKRMCIEYPVMILSDLILLSFFKQKTAYDMRISDWSSDVCSSDLLQIDGMAGTGDLVHRRVGAQGSDGAVALRRRDHVIAAVDDQIGRASCRETVCQYV